MLAGLGGAAVLGALALRDPHVEGSWGYCPFLLLTGRPCPGCGGLRAMNDLAHGDVVAALSSNVVAVALLAAAAAGWVVWLARRARGSDAPFFDLSPRLVVVMATVFVVFGVVRNTPWGAWLAP